LKTRNKQKAQKVKLLEAEVKNTRKCQKREQKSDLHKTRAIVATMTLIGERWEQLSAQDKRVYLLIFEENIIPL
jgi:hypothetical protein